MNLLNLFSGKPNKVNKSTPIIKVPTESKSDFQLINQVQTEFQKALDHFEEDRERENLNWRLYSGLNNGQWPAEAVSKLMSEGRNVGSYNIIRGKIDTLAGSYLKNYFDVDFASTEGKYNDLTAVLKTLYLSDKEMLDWDQSYLQFVIDFLIFGGTEELVVSQRYSSFGNLGFERIMPGHVVFDPDWLTLSGWDLKKCWKISYMTADELKANYNTKSDMIDSEILMLLNSGKTYDSSNFDYTGIPEKDLNQIYGSKHRVIEEHYIEAQTKKIELAFQLNPETNSKDLIELPNLPDEQKREWIALNNVSMSDGVIKDKKQFNVYKIRTCCPTLLHENFLEEGEPIIQVGRLPIFHTSAARMNGTDSGIVDLLKDVQQTINKRESLLDHMIASSASGAAGVDPQIVGNDVSKMEDISENWANPSFKFWTQAGEIASGRRHVEELPRTQFPSDIVNELTRMYEVMDKLSKVGAAQEGRSEGSEDRAGSIYARKVQQAEISATVMLKNLEFHWNQKGEAYMLAAKTLYSDVPREFKVAGTNDTIVINQETQEPNGQQKKLNDIGQLPRHKVIVTLSPGGTTYREVDRSINAELLNAIPQEHPLSRAKIVANVVKTLPNTTSERAELERSSALEMVLAEEQVKTQIINMKFQQAQMQMQMQQMMNPQPQAQPGQEGPQQPQGQQGQPQPEQQGQPEPPQTQQEQMPLQ
jgi:hypothetical protein